MKHFSQLKLASAPLSFRLVRNLTAAILRSDSRRALLAGMTSYFVRLKSYNEINVNYCGKIK